MAENNLREQFATRAGFILMTAGCAIGLGNVWRFAYITGQYGGGFFVLLYLVFLAFLGFPVMLMELAVGRAGRNTFPGAIRNLQNPQSKFAWYKPVYLLFSGNLILLMFYSVITGWLLMYSLGFIMGKFSGVTAESCGGIFGGMLDSVWPQIAAMLAGMVLTVAVCMGGVRKTIEKVIKVMMGGLFVLLFVLVIQSLCLPDAIEGVKFFLKPDLNKFWGDNMLETVHAAMAQAFFTLSLGIGSIAVCGSYMDSNNSLPREGVWIIALDTMVAVCSGLVIFPACASFGIKADAGPALIFITLPRVFEGMTGGVYWGCVFFIFLSIAALSTLIAVFENLAAFGMEEWKWSRKKSCLIFGVITSVMSLPCIFGFNIWKKIQLLGKNTNILDLEDFIVSDNLLPLGALFITIFCMSRYGWGQENFCRELSKGNGWVPGKAMLFYMCWVLPLVIIAIWLVGICKRFSWI